MNDSIEHEVEKIEHVVEKIAFSLRSRKTKEISGALLGEMIKKEIPHLNIREVVKMPVGPGALSKFIDLYLSTILQRDHRSGVDWIYKIKTTDSTTVLPINPFAWKVFASPSKTHSIFLDRSNQSLIVKLLSEIQGDMAIQKIDSVTREELKEIQKQFLASIDNAQEREKLGQALTGVNSYQKWMKTLQSENLKQYHLWTEFRRKEIGGIFFNRIARFGLDGDIKVTLLADLMKSQAMQHHQIQKLIQIENKPHTKEALPRKGVSNTEQNFRAVLITILSNMPIEELRQIRLPYGDVFDVLTMKKSD